MSIDPTIAFFFGGSPGGPEILLVLLGVLVLFGAKRLPEIARNLGRSMEEFKRAARDVTDEIMHADTKPVPKPKSLPPPGTEPVTPAAPVEPPPEDEPDDGDA